MRVVAAASVCHLLSSGEAAAAHGRACAPPPCLFLPLPCLAQHAYLSAMLLCGCMLFRPDVVSLHALHQHRNSTASPRGAKQLQHHQTLAQPWPTRTPSLPSHADGFLPLLPCAPVHCPQRCTGRARHGCTGSSIHRAPWPSRVGWGGAAALRCICGEGTSATTLGCRGGVPAAVAVIRTFLQGKHVSTHQASVFICLALEACVCKHPKS